MLIALLVLAAITLISSGFAAFLAITSRNAENPPWFEASLRERIVLHTKNDQSFEGSLMAATADGVILRAAKLLGPARTADRELPGEVFVPRENVAFCQSTD